MKIRQAFVRHIESSAYILALISFVVVFLESIIKHYVPYHTIELGTAWANMLLLSFTAVGRFLARDIKTQRNLLIFDLALLLLGALLMFYQAKFVIFFLLIRQTFFILQFLIFRSFEGRLYKVLTDNPAISLMLSFAIVILIGTLMLMLPSATTVGRVTPFMDALFTATSATCVTGLAVYDTGTYFSLFGQLVILALIQIGGLGIMTISTAFALIMGRRLTLKLENIMHQVVGDNDRLDVIQLLKSIVLVTAIIEIIGAVLLFLPFSNRMTTSMAMYNAIFHSVSAFCNAGFSLFSDQLVGFVDSPVVNFSITGLILAGGLGFAVLIDLYRYVIHADRVRKLSLHSKIVLLTSSVLLLIGFVAFYVAEYHGTMAGFTISRRILSSWFQSVTTRTAGFNTIDITGISSASVLICVVLMFIGASPGSTGGGIKTTTFAALVLAVRSMLNGRMDVGIFNRKIPATNLRESTSLIMLSAGILFVIVFLLMLAEPYSFEKLLFESVSAFGTVGLSMGITSQLTDIGKALITILMYVGRIGPLTMIYAFSMRRRQLNIDYAEEKIAIG